MSELGNTRREGERIGGEDSVVMLIGSLSRWMVNGGAIIGGIRIEAVQAGATVAEATFSCDCYFG